MKHFTDKDYEEHLKAEHSFSISGYLKEIVYGGSDGIVTTFAVVAGFAGAQAGGVLSNYPLIIVLVFGFANLFADAFSMGLGNMLSVFADRDVYKTEKDKELYEIKNNRETEIAESVYILKKQGFSENDAKKITELYSKNENYWAEFMMRYELELPTPEHENPFATGFATFLSFAVFGFIPLIPYIFLRGENLFTSSILFTFIALVLLGVFRWKVTTQTLWRAVGEIVLLGGTAATIAYFVGTLFK